MNPRYEDDQTKNIPSHNPDQNDSGTGERQDHGSIWLDVQPMEVEYDS